MTSAKTSCCVCGDEIGPANGADCGSCGLPYHLNQRSDLPGKDCGDAWIDEERLGLVFACNTCIEGEQGSPGDALSEILDVVEVAALLGTDEDTVIAAAESGYLRHRKLRAGVYLFEREAVLVFRRDRR